MEWNKAFGGDNQPSYEDISNFIRSELWADFISHLQETYGVQPIMSHSICSMQAGWNVKYRKGGKTLCTLYPMDGYFIALVVIGAKEAPEADLLLPSCCEYIQELYRGLPSFSGGKWMMIEVTNKDILDNTKELIALRVKKR